MDKAKEIASNTLDNYSEEELAFYDALTKPEAIKDFYQNDEIVALTKELTDMLRKNRTIDWHKKESARAGMRKYYSGIAENYVGLKSELK